MSPETWERVLRSARDRKAEDERLSPNLKHPPSHVAAVTLQVGNHESLLVVGRTHRGTYSSIVFIAHGLDELPSERFFFLRSSVPVMRPCSNSNQFACASPILSVCCLQALRQNDVPYPNFGCEVAIRFASTSNPASGFTPGGLRTYLDDPR